MKVNGKQKKNDPVRRNLKGWQRHTSKPPAVALSNPCPTLVTRGFPLCRPTDVPKADIKSEGLTKTGNYTFKVPGTQGISQLASLPNKRVLRSKTSNKRHDEKWKNAEVLFRINMVSPFLLFSLKKVRVHYLRLYHET